MIFVAGLNQYLHGHVGFAASSGVTKNVPLLPRVNVDGQMGWEEDKGLWVT